MPGSLRPLETFLELLECTPSLRVLEARDPEGLPITEAVAAAIAGCDGTLDFIGYGFAENFDASLGIKQKTYPLKPMPLRVEARAYEYLILNCAVPMDEAGIKLLKSAYRALENSGELIVLQPRHVNASAFLEWLRQSDFRAPNQIDLFDTHHLFTGKKMHMWGSGL